MKAAKCISLVVTVAIVLMSLWGCNKDAITEITLSEVIHSVFYAPQYVALNQGFFEDEGLKVNLEVAWGADKGAAALLSGSADIALFGVEAAIYSLKENAENPIIAFAQLTQKDGSFLIGRNQESDFKWEHLKDKVIIGGREGGMPQMVQEWILRKHELIPHKDVEIIQNIQLSATAAAFAEGVGDYVQLWEPGGTKLEHEGKGYIVASMGEASGKIPYTVYHATKEYITSNPEILQAFTNAIYKAQQWCNTHSAEKIAETIRPKHFEEFDLSVLTEVISRYKEIGVWDDNPILEKEALDLMQRIMISYGTLHEKVEFSSVVTNSFAEEAIR